MPNVTNIYPQWSAYYNYKKWDVVKGDGVSSAPIYYYNLKDDNFNVGPSYSYSYALVSSTRDSNVNRLYFTQIGTEYIQPGSVIEIFDCLPDPSINYSGIALAAGPGYVDYLNPGLSVSNAIMGGTLHTPIHPYWTTGFAWIPSWSSEVTSTPTVNTAAMGEGYTQRQNPAINSNTLKWNLVFDNREDNEAAALRTFLQDKGGVGHFPVPFPVGRLHNNPNLKFINGPTTEKLNSYGLNMVSVELQMCFDL